MPKTQTHKYFFNSILRRVRYALSLNDSATQQIFALVDYDMPLDYLHGIMKAENEQGFIPCRDKILALFLDGVIIKKRGAQEGKAPKVLQAGERLSNNDILRKLKIAMQYQEQDMLDILRLANFPVGKSELSALFRNPSHRNYKPCQDQLLRNFLQGMVKRHRPEV